MSEDRKIQLNPPVKKGDYILVTKTRNGNTTLLNKVVEVFKGVSSSTSTSNIVVLYKNPHSNMPQQYSVYRSGSPKDEYVLATKDSIIQSLEDAKQPYLEKIMELDKLIEFHQKYANEEEFAADKLDTLINTAQSGGKKEDRIKLMAEVLRELKATNYL